MIMEERKRLGRGLEDVSRFYLSSRPRGASERTRKSDSQPVTRHVIRIFYPGSSLIKSCFLANFALELARNRFHVDIWDGDRSEGIRVGTMLQQVVRQGCIGAGQGLRPSRYPRLRCDVQPEGKLHDLESSCLERPVFLVTPRFARVRAQWTLPSMRSRLLPSTAHRSFGAMLTAR